MIRKLVLVRHGDAENRRLGESDAERRLTKRGVAALKEAYPATFASLADDLDDLQIWSSEAVRARQTAEVVCDSLGIPHDAIEPHMSLYAQDWDFFYGELEAAEGVVVAVGHIPFMHRILWKLTGEDAPFSKGSVASVVFENGDIDKATLEWFVDGPED